MTADDWVKVIEAIAGAVVLVLGAIGALYAKLHQYHREVNGAMARLIELTSSDAFARGQLQERVERRVRDATDTGRE